MRITEYSDETLRPPQTKRTSVPLSRAEVQGEGAIDLATLRIEDAFLSDAKKVLAMSWKSAWPILISIASFLTHPASLLITGPTEHDWTASALKTWKAVWSPYRMIDREGIERRLIKAGITLPDEPRRAISLALCDSHRTVLDSERIPPQQKKSLATWLLGSIDCRKESRVFSSPPGL